jgi:ABC-type transport system involved in multi-copper enzyme maturation permease subunit
MLPGPVFTFELLITARRRRFYLLRATYAAILLLILWTIHAAWTADTQGELPLHVMKWVAISAFCGITIGQELLVLALTPALVAGSIADEKRRKTLHDLLASRLTGLEIVVGKLLVRVLHLMVLLAVSLPVLSLLVLLGGIDARMALLSCAATFSTAWFVAALAIWVSTIARKPHEALFVTFGLECLWLFAPPLLRTMPVTGWPLIDDAVFWLATWTGASSPADVGWRLLSGFPAGPGTGAVNVEILSVMIGLQLGAGLMLAVLAAWQLRPIFRLQEGAGEGPDSKQPLFVRSLRRVRRFGGRPELGHRPMLWKEMRSGGSRGIAQVVGSVLTIIGGGFVAYFAVWYGALAIAECWEHGYGPVLEPRRSYSQPSPDWRTADREAFYSYLESVVPLIYIVGIVAVAGSAATAITSEHEDATWASLTTTDLSGREIVLSKQLGAMKRGRRFAEVIVLLAAAGAIAGSIHLLSIPALIIALGVYGWFAAALGVWISLRFRTNWLAQVLTISALFLVTVSGQMLLDVLADFGIAPQVSVGFTPGDVARLLLTPAFLHDLAAASWTVSLRVSAMDNSVAWRTIFSIVSVLGYAAFAALLTWGTLHRFDIAAGRARRPKWAHPAEEAGSRSKFENQPGAFEPEPAAE